MHKDGCFANKLNPAKSALKIPQCMLKLTGQIAVKDINTLKNFREGNCSLLEIEIKRTVCEVFFGNHAMCLLL